METRGPFPATPWSLDVTLLLFPTFHLSHEALQVSLLSVFFAQRNHFAFLLLAPPRFRAVFHVPLPQMSLC